MSYLVACLGNDREDWDALKQIINSGVFTNIYLITGQEAKENFILENRTGAVISFIMTNPGYPLDKLYMDIEKLLKNAFAKDKITELDIAVNIISGTGKEHTALISALMKLGYGIRLVGLDSQGDVVAF